MLIPLVAALAFVPLTHRVSCEDVRQVHALAVSQGLDDTTLRTLEAQVCGAPAGQPPEYPPNAQTPISPPANQHAKERPCIDLEIMSVLGHTGGADHLEEIDGLMHVACSLGLSSPTLNWKNGTTARYGNGSWNWPSGTTARYGNGSWNWPSGTTAKYTTGAWNWPSGTTARYSNGRFNDVNGTSTAREQLIAAACERAPERCQQLGAYDAIDPDLGMAALLSLAWH